MPKHDPENYMKFTSGGPPDYSGASFWCLLFCRLLSFFPRSWRCRAAVHDSDYHVIAAFRHTKTDGDYYEATGTVHFKCSEVQMKVILEEIGKHVSIEKLIKEIQDERNADKHGEP
jgi:hypothetical protein